MESFRLCAQAEHDLDELYRYITIEDGPDRARLIEAEVLQAVRLLARMPGMGHRRPDLTTKPLRFWPVHRWLVVYREDSIPLLITRVIGGWQDLQGMTLDESDLD